MSSAWLSSLAKINVFGTSVRPGKISVKSLSRKVRMTVRIWSSATTSRSSWLASYSKIFVQLLPAHRAGLPVALVHVVAGVDLGAAFGDLGVDAVDVVVDVDAVGDRLFVAVLHHQVLIEKAEGLLVGRGGKADQVGVEVFQHLAPEIVDRAVAFVGNDDIEGLDRDGRVVFDGQRFFEERLETLDRVLLVFLGQVLPLSIE